MQQHITWASTMSADVAGFDTATAQDHGSEAELMDVTGQELAACMH